MQVQYTVQELEAKKVRELRHIAREYGITTVVREGKKFDVSYARKNELVEALASRIVPIEKVIETAKETIAVEAEREPQKDSEYQVIEDEQDAIAKLFFEGEMVDGKWQVVGLKEIFIRNVQAQNPLFAVNDFFALVGQFRPTIERHLRERTDELNPHTLLNWRSTILKKIEGMVEAVSVTDESQKQELQATYSRFYTAAMSAFTDVGKVKRLQGNAQLKRREDNAVEVNVAQLVEWAKDRVTNLPEKKTGWSEVAVAIMILTGRRQSEVMATGRFEPTDSDSYLEFSGQLKRHTDEVVKPFEIPVLGNAATGVINGVKWLEAYGKREETPKAAHNRFSRYLSAAAKQACGYITSPAKDWWEHEDVSGKIRDRRKCHLFRQIYGQVVIPVFFNRVDGRGKKAKRILAEVMGHSDSPSSRDYAAEAYDADVFVIDAQKLR